MYTSEQIEKEITKRWNSLQYNPEGTIKRESLREGVLRDLYPPFEQVQEWKEKAQQWDDLEAKIATYYFDDEGNELPEYEGGGLADIGETAAIAFGFL